MTASIADRYRVSNPSEVLAYLNEASTSHILCSVRAAGHPENYLSRLFAIDQLSQQLVFDAPHAPVVTRALVPGSQASIELTLHHVRIGFEAPVIAVAAFKGDPSLFIGLPASVTRLQRRENFRISIPLRRTVRLSLDDELRGLQDLRLTDLSCGGASVVVNGSLEMFPTGRIFDQARLFIADEQIFEVAARVRHASAVRRSGQQAELRLGLQFLHTPPGFEPSVARLVNEIALELSRIRR